MNYYEYAGKFFSFFIINFNIYMNMILIFGQNEEPIYFGYLHVDHKLSMLK